VVQLGGLLSPDLLHAIDEPATPAPPLIYLFLYIALLSKRMAYGLDGAAYGDVRLGCWRIAGSLAAVDAQPSKQGET
jgi:hypothetical protein